MVASLWDDLLPCPVIYASWDSFSFAGPSQVGQGCSVLPVENGGVWLPRLDKRHHFSFFLASSWIACSGESQLPCYKGPQAAYGKVPCDEGLRPPVSSHLSAPSRKWILQPHSGLQMTAALANILGQSHQRPWAKTTKVTSRFLTFRNSVR